MPEQIQQAKPARPGPLKLYDEPFKRCGKAVCLTPAEAKRALDNKVQVYDWMSKANALFCYYEVRDGAERCVTPEASSPNK